MAINQETLNHQAVEAVTFLASHLPTLTAGVRVEEREPRDNWAEGYLNVYLGNPSQPDRPLCVSTEMNEISIFFGETHIHIGEHFGDGGKTEAELIEKMIVRVVRIISGVELTYSAWAEDQCLGGGMLYSVRGKELPREFRDRMARFTSATRFRVVGWNVAHNADIKNIAQAPGQ